MGRGKSQRSLALIDAAYEVLAEIQPATVRAVCYRLFTMNLIDSMAKNETNKVSVQLTYAREHDLIPWEWIVDETREPERVSAWANPKAYIDTVMWSYRRDRWIDQEAWLEVWSEKGTVRGTLAPVLRKYGVTFRVMHGYGSATAIHDVAIETCDVGKPLTVLYVGDYDPSGLHMSEVDLPRRLAAYGGDVTIERLALTKADTRSGLPSFAATTKKGDSRYAWYVCQCLSGQRSRLDLQCWELDALSPVVLRERIEAAIVASLDLEAWDQAAAADAAERDSLRSILSAWPSISRPAQE
jgi:hypothetical protein